MVLKMTSFVAGLVMLCSSCMQMPQDTIQSRTVIDMDAVIAEHTEWVIEIHDPDYDASKNRYILDEVAPVLVDSDMLDTYYGLLECGKRKFPELNDKLGDVSFHEVKWFTFKEGWYLSKNSHKGYQMAGLVLAGHWVGIVETHASQGKTICHELYHVLYPGFGHPPWFWNLLNGCWQEVWYRSVDQ